MKQLLTILIVMTFLVIPLRARADSEGNARTSLIEGNVYLKAADTNNEWQSVTINTPVMQDDAYWVAEGGKAEIQFFGSSYLRADQNTEFHVTSLDGSSNTVIISLQSGRVYIDRQDSPQGTFFEIDAPLVSVDADRSARFDVNISNDGDTEISVISGSVNIDSESESTTIYAGDMVAVSNSGAAEVSSYLPDDEWISWNASQDDMLAENSRSAAYLPPSLADYSYEFDNNGNWTYITDYGYVWTPVIVTPDWAPYSIGRWAWIGGNYVWISYETWGWVPYHYGRWAYRTGIGWFWVPPSAQQVYWCPGAVAWDYTSNYVFWVPLAPGEVYYGYGYYGPNSVNLRNVNRRAIRTAPYYENARISNAVTVVSRQTFVSGRVYTRLRIPENPFTQGKAIAMVRPPERGTLQSGRQFRQVTPPQVPNRQIGVVAHRQPQRQFRQVTPPQIPQMPNRQIGVVTHRQPQRQFRQITPPQIPQMPNRQIGVVTHRQPQRQFRQITPPQIPQMPNRQIGVVVQRQPQRQFRQVTPPQIPQMPNRQIGVVAWPQQRAAGAQNQQYRYRESSQPMNRRMENIQTFR